MIHHNHAHVLLLPGGVDVERCVFWIYLRCSMNLVGLTLTGTLLQCQALIRSSAGCEEKPWRLQLSLEWLVVPNAPAHVHTSVIENDESVEQRTN